MEAFLALPLSFMVSKIKICRCGAFQSFLAVDIWSLYLLIHQWPFKVLIY